MRQETKHVSTNPTNLIVLKIHFVQLLRVIKINLEYAVRSWPMNPVFGAGTRHLQCLSLVFSS
jgi:hypothetical protein